MTRTTSGPVETGMGWLKRKLLRTEPPEQHEWRPKIPAGKRVYAIGDVHGRLDLLVPLLVRIQNDDLERGPAETHVILLGDLVDRGPYSAEVIEFFVKASPTFAQIHVLMGNHEEAMLRAMSSEPDRMGALWLQFGGLETLQSYGVPLPSPGEAMPTAATIKAYVPDSHQMFLMSLPNHLRFGDYMFAHAGIRPGVHPMDQSPADLRWIRGEFLESQANHGVIVVHGHTITEQMDIRPNRIGIDTGAFRTNILTAIGLEDERRWAMETCIVEGKIQTKLSTAF